MNHEQAREGSRRITAVYSTEKLYRASIGYHG